MDTSQQYIKMCQEASEVQALEQEYQKKCIIPNLFAVEAGVEKDPIVYAAKGLAVGREIWLPRQDQLQEMCKQAPNPALSSEVIEHIALPFSVFSGGRIWFKTFEQTWLGFYMFWVQRKKWDWSIDKWEKF